MTNRTERIAFVVTPDEKELIKEKAKERGQSMSSYLRKLSTATLTTNQATDMLKNFIGNWYVKTEDQLDDIERCACTRGGASDYELRRRREEELLAPKRKDSPSFEMECEFNSDRSKMICEMKDIFGQGAIKPSEVFAKSRGEESPPIEQKKEDSEL